MHAEEYYIHRAREWLAEHTEENGPSSLVSVSRAFVADHVRNDMAVVLGEGKQREHQTKLDLAYAAKINLEINIALCINEIASDVLEAKTPDQQQSEADLEDSLGIWEALVTKVFEVCSCEIGASYAGAYKLLFISSSSYHRCLCRNVQSQ